MKDSAILAAIKLLHTAVWLFFVACIASIPIAGLTNHLQVAALCIFVVLVECLVLALNRAQCPHTILARRYTQDRAENFDIYLPLWLARHNQLIFGIIYTLASLFVAVRWWTSVR